MEDTRNIIILATDMMDVFEAQKYKNPKMLLDVIVVIMTYAIDQGFVSKDLQVAKETLGIMQDAVLKLLKDGTGWKNYN